MTSPSRPHDTAIVIDLHGAKARRGIELDGLQLFLEHFRRALREFDRVVSRRAPLPRTGRPDAAADLATAFRLVHFEIGSGIATLEPAPPADSGGEQLALADVTSPATANLAALVDALTTGEAGDAVVVDALDRARRALGEDGSFGVLLPGRSRAVVDPDGIKRLGASVRDTTDAPLTVSGRVHLIEIEEPSKVAIRATDGTDWICAYARELEPRVLGLVKQLVWAQGTGARTSTGRGRMRLESIEPVPRHVQSALFADEPRPTGDLAAEQGIAGPQGLASTSDPAWVDDEAADRFLAFVMGNDHR